MRILIATDAWRPQINGVVQTYMRLSEQLERLGHEVCFLTPDGFFTLPMPTYPEIRLALITRRAAGKHIEAFAPNHIHIATEGPIGLATRAYCLKSGRHFTSSYHTRFPEYLNTRFPFIPVGFGYWLERWFHSTSSAVLVATNSLKEELEGKGLKELRLWSRGVDTEFFRPRDVRRFGDGPVFLYVGRVAVEKNIAAFLDLELPGKKVVVGGGPQFAELKAVYPHVTFTGSLSGEPLAEAFSSADVFVFPSRTDTYGIVLLEAMASGLPVAAYPVTGPIDVVANGQVGALDEDLRAAALRALTLDRAAAREYALRFSWETCAQQFLGYMPHP